jgi:hypothetical protein
MRTVLHFIVHNVALYNDGHCFHKLLQYDAKSGKREQRFAIGYEYT